MKKKQGTSRANHWNRKSSKGGGKNRKKDMGAGTRSFEAREIRKGKCGLGKQATGKGHPFAEIEKRSSLKRRMIRV